MRPRDLWAILALLALLALLPNARAGGLSITAFSPADHSANICIDAPLRLTFSGPVVLTGRGKITIHRASDNQVEDEFDLSAVAFTNDVGGKTLRYEPVRIEGNVAEVQLHSHALRYGESYRVIVEPDVFASAAGGPANNFAWTFSTRAACAKGRTNLVVAADGTGDFCTPQGAVDYIPDDNSQPVEIFVRNGTYWGMVYIAADKGPVRLMGEDRKKTVIEGRNNERLNSGRIGRGLVSVDANDFVAENLTLRNTTPYGGSQAEALSLKGERCILRNADFYSFQDTLLLTGQVYVTNCYAEGDVDFVWGQGSVFFDHCELKAVHKGYYVQARNPAGHPGYVFFQCRMTASPEVPKCVLARIDADRFPNSQVVYINCQMGGQVPPIGWEIKGTNVNHLDFAEYHSTDAEGNSIDTSGRHPASRQLTESEAAALSDPAKVLSMPQAWNPRAAAQSK